MDYAWLIALVALVQPWIWAAYRRWIRAGKVEVYESGGIELSFAHLGPTLMLQGTLRAQLEDVFIRKLEVEVTRLNDKATHVFEWVAFLGPVPTAGPRPWSLPHSFNLLRTDSSIYSVAFSATKIAREIQSLLLPLRDAWNQHPVNIERREILASRGNLGPDFSDRAHEAWSVFIQSSQFVETYTEVQRRCYWEAGQYRITMRVYSPKRKTPISCSWCFAIDEQQAKSLRLNAIAVVHQACGEQGDWSLNSVVVSYGS